MSSLQEQGTWVKIEHGKSSFVFDRLTVTRVDVVKLSEGDAAPEAVTIHQQGLHEWIRIAPLPAGVGSQIRNVVIGLEETEWV